MALLAACVASPALRAAGPTSSSEIVLGQFAAHSGPAAELGRRMKVGIETCFSDVNAAGGVHGRTLRLVARDDGYEPERAAAACKQLIAEDRVFALIGSVGTPTNIAAVPAINAEGIPLIGPFTGAQALREPFNRNIFHVRASYFDETERIVEHLTTLGNRKIGVFYQNDSYGMAGLAGVKRAMDKRGLQPAMAATVERNTVDVAAALKQVLAAQPEAVVQISAYKSCAALIKQARAAGYGGQFFNVSFVGSKALSDQLGDSGPGVVISQVVPFPYSPASALVRDYQLHMAKAGHKELDFSSLEGYIAAKVVVEGLRRAGKAPTRESLVAALETFQRWDAGGFYLSYSAGNHEGSRFTDLTIIGREGRFVR
ncbi:ABC transporter substrate-binding protein [Ramlibacter sp. GTP1]|uniref:ABC transporter substrate-binding protein n=2 Tax=Ramlibacter albus TaxID=2079448 RepID=A0A923M6R1_9BURK|nr:ABC transporter substrate-binding protein [Ramlibacter albus]